MKVSVKTVMSLLLFFLYQFSDAMDEKTVYQSQILVITQISENVFKHISYLNTQSFGRVSCNGMIVKDLHEAVIFDTTVDDESSAELINWIENNLHCKITAVISTHFHDDCLGGLQAFFTKKIPSYALSKTIHFASENGAPVPENGFENSMIWNVGDKEVYAQFFGEGHTRDNIVGYFPSENVLFGGCLIKEMNAGKGYLGDANIEEWPETVKKIINAYPDVKIIVPGHGENGNKELLNYTIQLFRKG